MKTTSMIIGKTGKLPLRTSLKIKSLLLGLFLSLFTQTGISQSSTFRQTQQQDLILQEDFQAHLDLLLSLPNDSIVNPDHTTSYDIKFSTTHAFDLPSELYDSCYADSTKLICLENVSRRKISRKLDYIDRSDSFSGSTKLNGHSDGGLRYTRFKKLNVEDPKEGYFCTIISFNKGQYLIISERRFEEAPPGKMPPGYDITFFLKQ